MRRITLLLMLNTAAFGGSAQSTFMQTFSGTGTARANLNELASGNLLTGMTRGSGISMLDPQGNFIHSHIYENDTFLNMKSVRRYADNEFFFAGGYYKDPCTDEVFGSITRTHPVVGRMDSMGNILAAQHYVLDANFCRGMLRDVEVITNKNVLGWGDDALFALRVDSAGELLWAKYFAHHGTFQFIKELPGGDLLAGINLDTAGAVVARLGPLGNILWCRSYMSATGTVHDAVVRSDDSFVISGYTETTSLDPFTPLPGAFHPKLFLMKLNGSGDVLWCRGYDNLPGLWHTPSVSRMIRAQDDSYVMLATLGQVGFNNFLRPFLMKVDLNGDTLWTRSNGRTEYNYETRSLLEYSDGGFLYNGRIWGEMPNGSWNNWAYFYKTDPEGHLPCHERFQPIQVIELFPTDRNIALSSMDGGAKRAAFIQDAAPLPNTIYEVCSVFTGMMSSNRVGHRMSIRPNPNTGRFTIEFADPLMAESYYSVYDTMGKLLYQRPLPTGATLEEVDLARFGRGTYVLRLTDPEGVSHERVAVE